MRGGAYRALGPGLAAGCARYSALLRFAPSPGKRVVLRRIVRAAAVSFDDSHVGEPLERPRAQLTMNTYAHAIEANDRDAADAIGEML